MSNSLLEKVHFDLLVDAFARGPADASDWPLEFTVSDDELGRMLVRENLRSMAWHWLWRDIYTSFAVQDENAMTRASEYAAAACDNPYVLDVLFDHDIDDLRWRLNYRFQRRARRLTCLQLIDLIGTWTYHSSEHLDWPDIPQRRELISEAHATAEEIISTAAANGPGVRQISAWDAYTDVTAPRIPPTGDTLSA